MFSHNSGFYLAPTLVCKGGKGATWNTFYGFESLRREPETSVKMYLLTQKQERESGVREEET